VKIKERYSFIILVMISLLVGGANIGYTIKHSTETRHKFCEVVDSLTNNPVSRPPNPSVDPSREHAWEIYAEFKRLRSSLGCPPIANRGPQNNG
jgi:hypothetical protein